MIQYSRRVCAEENNGRKYSISRLIHPSTLQLSCFTFIRGLSPSIESGYEGRSFFLPCLMLISRNKTCNIKRRIMVFMKSIMLILSVSHSIDGLQIVTLVYNTITSLIYFINLCISVERILSSFSTCSSRLYTAEDIFLFPSVLKHMIIEEGEPTGLW